MSAQADILIVEDSKTQAELLRYLLEKQNYNVTHAADGKLGLEQARRQTPTLIISDVEMPVMDGYEMCRQLKADPQLRTVPVILLTSLSDPADILRGLSAQADYYLTKPFDNDYFLSQVEAVLSNPYGLHASAETPPPMEVFLQGQKHTITADRREILNLLLSTYGNAVQRNRELGKAHADLNEQARQLRLRDTQLSEQNRRLEETVQSERVAMEALKKAESQMVQTEKLASLGQMVAGVAHEINNPLAFVVNNVAVLQRDFSAIAAILKLYQDADAALASDPKLLTPIHELSQRIDLPYTLSNLEDVLARSKEGLNRIQQIVRDLRDFARLDQSDLSEVDINASIESTTNIVRHKATRKHIKIAFEFGSIPFFTCYPAKFNQVVMNLLTNAIDASSAGDTITLRTRMEGTNLLVEVEDMGAGIDPAIRDRIFDPFFTTKPPGQGTGLGLSISYGIVHDHGGRIDVRSNVDRGSCFTMTLPVRPRTT